MAKAKLIDGKPVVKLIGTDGNVFSIISKCRRALKDAGLSAEADAYRDKCLDAKSYDEVLQLSMRYCDVN